MELGPDFCFGHPLFTTKIQELDQELIESLK